MDSSVQTAFEQRLQWLEWILHGSTSTSSSTSSSVPNTDSSATDLQDENNTTLIGVQRRTIELEDKLREALANSGHDGLKSFAANYDSYANLIFPSNPSFPSPTDPSIPSFTTATTTPPSSSTTPHQPSTQSLESILLPTSSKIDLILSSELDLKEMERGLREMEVLVGRGVMGSGKLGEYESLLPRLHTLQLQHTQNLQTHQIKQRQIAQILTRYNDYVSNTSQLFINMHKEITELEEMVGIMEREKRERAAERY